MEKRLSLGRGGIKEPVVQMDAGRRGHSIVQCPRPAPQQGKGDPLPQASFLSDLTFSKPF